MQLQKNMPEWVPLHVPYSHFVNKTWGFPTDCSGFISWALQFKADGNRFIKAYEYGSRMYSRLIETDDLQSGDIITHVWAPKWAPGRCGGKKQELITGMDDNTTEEDTTELEKVGEDLLYGEGNVEGIFDYLPGHVFFFDKWDDDAHTQFWAYESSSTDEQTKDCLEKGPKFCFNHHVLMKRKKVDKYRRENCTRSSSTRYMVT